MMNIHTLLVILIVCMFICDQKVVIVAFTNKRYILVFIALYSLV